jgi:hypothetical protein
MIAPPKPPAPDELEALIKEARERQLRRRLLGAAALAVVAAAGLGIYALAAGSNPVSSGDSSRPSGLAPPECRMSNFAVKEIPISNPTGLDRIGLQFTNLSSSCRVDGYPALRFSDAKGTIPFLFRYLGKPYATAVAGRHSIFSIFSKFRCDLPGGLRSATRTTVELPGDGGTPAVFPGGPGICAPGIPAEGRWVTVTPFQSLRAAYRVSLIGNGTGP